MNAVAWIVSALTGGLSLLAFASQDLAAHLRYDRAAVAAGEVWRWLTCHFVHGAPSFLLLDVGAFLGLWLAAVRTAPRRALAALGGAGVLVPAYVQLGARDLPSYEGLSGLASALFALLAVQLARRGRAAGNRAAAAVALGALALFLAKLGLELARGAPTFASYGGADLAPVPGAHLAGALAGWWAADFPFARPARRVPGGSARAGPVASTACRAGA